jgi:N-acetylneuraminic acid mutarotase
MKKYLFLLAVMVSIFSCQDEQPIVQPLITGFEPNAAGMCEWVRIVGSQFDSIAANNQVKFNGVQAEIEFASDTVLLVRVPVDASSGPIEVTVGGQTILSNEPFTLLKGHWKQLPDFPGHSRFEATGFVLNGKLYIGLGSQGSVFYDDFWEYDPATGAWTQKADYPGGEQHSATGFELNGKGYIGFGSNATGELYEYDAANDAWTQKASNAICGGSGPYVFTMNGKAYIGCSKLDGNHFFEYDPTADTWTEIPSAPPGDNRVNGVGFTLDEKGYMGLGGYTQFSDFSAFDPATMTWSGIAGLPLEPGTQTYEASAFTIDGSAYARVLHQFWSYDQAANVWRQVAAPCGNPAHSEVALATGGKGYLICGLAQPRFPEVANVPGYVNWDSNQVWEFTPED